MKNVLVFLVVLPILFSFKSKPKIGFKKIYQPAKFTNLTMIGKEERFGVEGDDGKVLRVLCYKNVTDAVEAKHPEIPKLTILAMVVQETSGVNLLPNALDDGGFGLCHMQPLIAKSLGLKTYKNCNEMVCHTHARELRGIIESRNHDNAKVYMYDDRLHPIIELDAVGRLISSYMHTQRVGGLSSFQSAICRYAGRVNYVVYFNRVAHYRALLSNKTYMADLEKRFNALNPDLRANGKKIDFKKFIALKQKENINYGLNVYKKS